MTEHGSSTLKTKSFSFLLFILSNVCLSCLSDFICYQYNNNNGGTLENERERVFAELSLVSSLVCSQLPSCSRHLSLMDWLTTFDFQSVCSNYWLTKLSFSTVDERFTLIYYIILTFFLHFFFCRGRLVRLFPVTVLATTMPGLQVQVEVPPAWCLQDHISRVTISAKQVISRNSEALWD